MIIHTTTEEEFFKKQEQILAKHQDQIVAKVLSALRGQERLEPSELICEKAAAAILGVSQQTLARRRKAGLIPYVPNGIHPMYKQETLDLYRQEVQLKSVRN